MHPSRNCHPRSLRSSAEFYIPNFLKVARQNRRAWKGGKAKTIQTMCFCSAPKLRDSKVQNAAPQIRTHESCEPTPPRNTPARRPNPLGKVLVRAVSSRKWFCVLRMKGKMMEHKKEPKFEKMEPEVRWGPKGLDPVPRLEGGLGLSAALLAVNSEVFDFVQGDWPHTPLHRIRMEKTWVQLTWT